MIPRWIEDVWEIPPGHVSKLRITPGRNEIDSPVANQTPTSPSENPLAACCRLCRSSTVAFGKGDSRILYVTVPLFFVSDARGLDLIGDHSGLYDMSFGQGLTNLKDGRIVINRRPNSKPLIRYHSYVWNLLSSWHAGLVPAKFYFPVRALSQLGMIWMMFCGLSFQCSAKLNGRLEGMTLSEGAHWEGTCTWTKICLCLCVLIIKTDSGGFEDTSIRFSFIFAGSFICLFWISLLGLYYITCTEKFVPDENKSVPPASPRSASILPLLFTILEEKKGFWILLRDMEKNCGAILFGQKFPITEEDTRKINWTLCTSAKSTARGGFVRAKVQLA